MKLIKQLLCLFSLLAIVGLTGCATHCSTADAPKHPPVRYAWVTGLKPEMVAHYEELHAHIWPGVSKMITSCHIQNYSIYEREINGQIYLFSYLEYTGTDFAADMARMAADPETQRWWKETDPCQQPLPDAAAKGQIWSDAKEVFFQR